MKHKEVAPKGYIAFELTRKSRENLLERFPPKFPDVFAHHITWKFGVTAEEVGFANQCQMFEVVGYAEDESLEALVIRIDDSLERPDGKIYHVTWSLDKSKGRKPVQSNDLVKKDWEEIPGIDFNAEAKFYRF